MQKLVRDKIPEIAKNRSFRTAKLEEMPALIAAKLVEEALEFQESGKLEELADLYDVMLAIIKLRAWSIEDVVAASQRKALERGSFEKRIVLLDIP